MRTLAWLAALRPAPSQWHRSGLCLITLTLIALDWVDAAAIATYLTIKINDPNGLPRAAWS